MSTTEPAAELTRVREDLTKSQGVVTTLSGIIRWMNDDIVAVTRSEDLITEDHDGDYQAIWERAHDLYPRIDQLTAERDRLRDGIEAALAQPAIAEHVEFVGRHPGCTCKTCQLARALRALLDGEGKG